MSKDEKIVFCTGGGCTAKLGAGVLSRILEKLPRGEKDPNLLVGYDRRWTFSHPWWMTPIPSGRSQRPTP